uniref:Fibrinogen C-terminal domain-containing protein n=1 Tax=Anopheles culicifacies TaxID=139723 RepID=A0A182M9D5_9DIPT
MEARIQTTLQEIARNQSRQLDELKLLVGVAGSPSLGLKTPDSSNTRLPNHNQITFHRETIAGIGNDRFIDGEWIMFQMRFNGSLLFNRTWNEYRDGFGDTGGEHWLGLDNLHRMLADEPHELLVVMESLQGTVVYAHYDTFRIGSALEGYAIKTIGNYKGTAGNLLFFQAGSKFSTYDQDNDAYEYNCAKLYNGGWWFKNCYSRKYENNVSQQHTHYST